MTWLGNGTRLMKRNPHARIANMLTRILRLAIQRDLSENLHERSSMKPSQKSPSVIVCFAPLTQSILESTAMDTKTSSPVIWCAMKSAEGGGSVARLWRRYVQTFVQIMI